MPKSKKNKKSSDFLKKENFIVFILLLVVFIIVLFFYYQLNIDSYDTKNKSKELSNKINIDFYNEVSLIAEVANTPIEKSEGLMYRSELGENKGMLFNFTSEKERSFWMKNTLIPLDIIFLDREKKIVDIILNMQPCEAEPCTVYDSSQPAMYAIEVNAGYVDKNNIKLGQKVDFQEI